ncbi:MAG TPA: hypothetical protein VN974_08370, partial [Candidatus Dormibacteraeota bacterium]|nr:hypothetical protein [Candidatus Dormibacteraeota bacterium]
VLLSELPPWHPLAAPVAEFPDRVFAAQGFVPWDFVRENFAVAALELAVLVPAHCAAQGSHQI